MIINPMASLTMRLFVAIVLLTVPLVMAVGESYSAKDEALALYDEIVYLNATQTKVSEGHYNNFVTAVVSDYAITMRRWSQWRNDSVEEVTTKAERVIANALDIGIDYRKEVCYVQYKDVVAKKLAEKMDTPLAGCVNVARNGEVLNLDQIRNFASVEMYSRIVSTAGNELAACEGATNAEPCYGAVVPRLEMFKRRMNKAANEMRIIYANELEGHINACDSSVALSLAEWQTQSLKLLTNCARQKIMYMIGLRNSGADMRLL